MVKANAEENMDEEGCVMPENYSKVTGDISVEYALEIMAKGEKGELQTLANDYLKQVKRGGGNE